MSSSSVKNIKVLLENWQKKSREVRRNQCIIASKIKANLANVEHKAEVAEMNELQSYAGERVS